METSIEIGYLLSIFIFSIFIFSIFFYMLLDKSYRAKKRLWEEKIYKQVVSDFENNEKRAGLWAMAISESNGSDEICKSIYINYCAQSIIGEHEILSTIRL